MRSAVIAMREARRQVAPCDSWAITALVEDEHPVGEQQRLVDVVGDEQDRRVACRSHSSSTSRCMVDAGQRVQRAERLVEQQQVGLADQGPGQRGALGLARRTASAARRRAARRARPPPAPPARARAPASAGLSSPSATLSSTRRHGSSRGSWKATRRCPSTSTSPGRRRGRARPGCAAAWTCPSRCGRAARRTRRGGCPGRRRRAPAARRRPGEAARDRRRRDAAVGRRGRPEPGWPSRSEVT